MLVETQVLELGDQFIGDYCVECCAVVNEQHPDILYVFGYLRWVRVM